MTLEETVVFSLVNSLSITYHPEQPLTQPPSFQAQPRIHELYTKIFWRRRSCHNYNHCGTIGINSSHCVLFSLLNYYSHFDYYHCFQWESDCRGSNDLRHEASQCVQGDYSHPWPRSFQLCLSYCLPTSSPFYPWLLDSWKDLEGTPTTNAPDAFLNWRFVVFLAAFYQTQIGILLKFTALHQHHTTYLNYLPKESFESPVTSQRVLKNWGNLWNLYQMESVISRDRSRKVHRILPIIVVWYITINDSFPQQYSHFHRRRVDPLDEAKSLFWMLIGVNEWPPQSAGRLQQWVVMWNTIKRKVKKEKKGGRDLNLKRRLGPIGSKCILFFLIF